MRYVILLVSLLLALSASAQDVESRCSELGSQCSCSETFNVFANLAAHPTILWNPANSVTKQCGDGCGGTIPQCDGPGIWMGEDYPTKAATPLSSAVSAFPSGQDPRVYQGSLLVSHGSGLQHIVPDAAQNVHNETVCSRVYRFFNDDVPSPLPNNGDRIKLDGSHIIADGTSTVLAFGSTQWTFGGISPAGGAYVQYVSYIGYTGTNEQEGFAGYQAKAKAGWVRQELCADIGDGTLQWRSRMHYLSDDSETTHTSDLFTGGPSVVDVVPGTSSLMGEGPSINGAPAGARQYASHYMQARVPLDDTFWIGPAYELETPGAPTLSVNLTCTPTSGTVGNIPNIDCTLDPINEGTGPDYKFEIDCDSTPPSEHTVERDDSTTGPVPSQAFTDICTGYFDTEGDHLVTGILKDFENAEFGGSPALTTSDIFHISVEPNVAQCPEPPQAEIVRIELKNSTNGSVIDSNFQSGDTIPGALKDVVYLEAVGNAFLQQSTNGNQSPGSVKFVIDGEYTWAPHCQFNHPLHSGGDDTADPRLAVVDTHTAVITPVDQRNTTEGGDCTEGVEGSVVTINFETLAP